MGECPNEMQLKHTSQLATMKNEIENIKNTVSDFSTIKDTLIKLTFLSEQTIEFNKRQLESNDKFEETLTKINENLNGLNGRVDHLENTKEEEEVTRAEKYKAKFTFYGVIVTGVLATLGILIPLLMK